MGVVSTFTRTMSFVERGSTASPSVVSLLSKDGKERRQAQFRSKSMVWKEPMQLLERISSGRVVKTNSFQQKDGQELNHSRPSKWARFWKKLKFDAVGKKVHAVLNYDSQSYAMNFEEDKEKVTASSHLMPKISGPGARQIVTVLLQRSSSTNRNSGWILIPKPVSVVRPVAKVPLWQRRRVQAPSLLDVRMRSFSIKRRAFA